jgi:nitrate reductase gamma subunit
MDAWLDFARGPAFRFALAIMVLGLLRHFALALLSVRAILKRAGDKTLPGRQIRSATLSWLFPVKRLGHHALFSIASVLFHVGAIVAPLFLAAHVTLVGASTGIAWPALNPLAADILTLLAIGGLLVLLVVRVAKRAARELSQRSDYGALFLVFVPFATGFLAAHPALNPFPFTAVLLLHFLSADLLLAAFPLTKLVHVVLLPTTQLVSEAAWRFDPDAGEKVAKALGKENQRI